MSKATYLKSPKTDLNTFSPDPNTLESLSTHAEKSEETQGTNSSLQLESVKDGAPARGSPNLDSQASARPEAPAIMLEMMNDLKEIGICDAGFKLVQSSPITIERVTELLTIWCESNIGENFLDELRCIISQSESDELYLSCYFSPEPQEKREYYIELLLDTSFGEEDESFTLEALEPVPNGQLAIFCIEVPFVSGFYMDDIREAAFTNYGNILLSIKRDVVKIAKRTNGQRNDIKTYNHVLVNLDKSQVVFKSHTYLSPPKAINYSLPDGDLIPADIILLNRVSF